MPRRFLLHQLHELEGRNLEEGQAPTRARAILEQLDIDVAESGPGLRPYAVWRMSDSKAAPITVLLMFDPRGSIPGSEWLRVVVWDEHGTQISKSPEFFLAYREDLYSAKRVRDPEGREVIEVVTTRRDPPRLYFAIVDGEAALVRLEGEPRRNVYVHPRATIGLPVPVVDRATCLAQLGSDDPFVVLALLVWLNGDHGPPELRHLPPEDLEPEEIRQHVRQLLTDAEVIAALQNVLQTFEHPWVRDAAHDALRLGAELTW